MRSPKALLGSPARVHDGGSYSGGSPFAGFTSPGGTRGPMSFDSAPRGGGKFSHVRVIQSESAASLAAMKQPLEVTYPWSPSPEVAESLFTMDGLTVVFRALLEDLGISATTKIIDMCAIRSARQVRRFVSKVPDAQAVWTDMYTHEWNTSNRLLRQNELLYFFPPENQLDRVLMKIQRDASPSVLIIMPLWSRSWLKRMQKMLISQPVVFGGGTQLLEPPEGRHIAEEIKQGQWQWVAALIDGRLSTTVSRHWDSHLNRPVGQWQVNGKKGLWRLL